MNRGTMMLQGRNPDGSAIFAAVDPLAVYVNAQPSSFKFSASLAPFKSEDAAREALAAAGAVDVSEVEARR